MPEYSPKSIEIKVMNLARYHPEQLPSCLCSLDFHCQDCSVGNEEDCLFLDDSDFLSLLRWRLLHLSELDDSDTSSDDIVPMLEEVFESQGSALHIDKIFALFQRRYPESQISFARLKDIIKDNSDFFKEEDANIFKLNPGTVGSQETQAE